MFVEVKGDDSLYPVILSEEECGYIYGLLLHLHNGAIQVSDKALEGATWIKERNPDPELKAQGLDE